VLKMMHAVRVSKNSDWTHPDDDSVMAGKYYLVSQTADRTVYINKIVLHHYW
jgi:hypothetical protein